MLEYVAHQPDFVVEENQELPNWFKNRARLWTQDRIGDNVFFDGVEQLFRTGVISVN